MTKEEFSKIDRFGVGAPNEAAHGREEGRDSDFQCYV